MEQDPDLWWASLTPGHASLTAAFTQFVEAVARALAEMDQLPPEERRARSLAARVEALSREVQDAPTTSAVVRETLKVAVRRLLSRLQEFEQS